MASPAYMTIIGSRQGYITESNFTISSVGNVWQEGHENEIMVQAFRHRVGLPKDFQTGQPTGQRMHEPLVITKVLDRCSPLLFRALTSGEKLTTVELKLYRLSIQGLEEHYFTMLFEDAVITNISTYMEHCLDPKNQHLTHMEEVEFTYRKITKTHEVASTSESDDWRKQT